MGHDTLIHLSTSLNVVIKAKMNDYFSIRIKEEKESFHTFNLLIVILSKQLRIRTSQSGQTRKQRDIHTLNLDIMRPGKVRTSPLFSSLSNEVLTPF